MENVDEAQYDEVSSKLNVRESPPEGLVFHTAGRGEDGVFRIFDVWETREAHDRFAEERLRPAVVEVVGEEAMQQNPPRQQFYELYDFFERSAR